MSSSWCVEAAACRAAGARRFQVVSPSGPKKSRRMLLSTPWTRPAARVEERDGLGADQPARSRDDCRPCGHSGRLAWGPDNRQAELDRDAAPHRELVVRNAPAPAVVALGREEVRVRIVGELRRAIASSSRCAIPSAVAIRPRRASAPPRRRRAGRGRSRGSSTAVSRTRRSPVEARSSTARSGRARAPRSSRRSRTARRLRHVAPGRARGRSGRADTRARIASNSRRPAVPAVIRVDDA